MRRKAHRPLQKSDRRDALAGAFTDPSSMSRGRRSPSFARPSRADVTSSVFRWPRSRLPSASCEVPVGRADSSTASGPTQDGTACSKPRRIYPRFEVISNSVEASRRTGARARPGLRRAGPTLARPAPAVADRLPGVGPIVALTTISVFADVSRFSSAKRRQLRRTRAKYHQSGDRDSHGHIAKRSSAELRSMLCEAAHHARRTSHLLNPPSSQSSPPTMAASVPSLRWPTNSAASRTQCSVTEPSFNHSKPASRRAPSLGPCPVHAASHRRGPGV